MTEQTKYCKDCKFLRRGYLCKKPTGVLDPVSGEMTFNQYYAEEERSREQSRNYLGGTIREMCGPQAGYWQPSLWYKVKKLLRIVK